MKNMKIRVKLITGFILILALLLVVSVVSIISITSMTQSAQDMYTNNSLPLSYMAEVYDSFDLQRVHTRSMVIAENQDDYNTALSQLSDAEAAFDQYFQSLGETAANDDVQGPLYQDINKQYSQDYAAIKDQIAAAAKLAAVPGGDNTAAKEALAVGGPIANNIKADLDKINTDVVKTAGETAAQAKQSGQNLVMILIILSVAAAALAVFLTLYISSLIDKPIKEMVEAAESIAEGDVNRQIEVSSRDEIGQLAGAFTRMTESIRAQVGVVSAMSQGDLSMTVTPRSEKDAMNVGLRDMLSTNNEIFSEITRGAENVSAGAKQVADGSQSLAQATTQQAAVVEELAGSIGQVSEKTVKNAQMAQEASALGQKINENAQTGATQMDNMMQAVHEINEASHSIGKVIKVIDDIAFQTNILALNAAVEAARAGQHGKGFAVVAEEVRSLAAKSADAAKDTGSLIANSIEKAELGSRIAQETSQSLVDIVSGIQQSSAIVADIARLSDEQAAAIAQINKGIDQVSQVVTANSATAEESAAASEEMSSQSTMLSELVSRFKLKEQRPGVRGDRLSSMAQKVTPPARRQEDDIDDTLYAVGGNDFGKY